jgi:thiol:disulfide interchange protein DsbD
MGMRNSRSDDDGFIAAACRTDSGRLPLLSWLVWLAFAFVLSMSSHVRADGHYLDPKAAFRFAATMADRGTVEVTYAIADGYYMYRERFGVSADNATLGGAEYPPGKIKFDETFQKNMETYRRSVTIRIPVQAEGDFTLKMVSQGCADDGLCYPPMESVAILSPSSPSGVVAATGSGILPIQNGGLLETIRFPASDGLPNGSSDMNAVEASLMTGSLLAIVPLFLLWGLALSFTPCVLPMVPILSSIIVGEGTRTRRSRALLLSSTYCLGMAIVYTALGVAAGLIGEGLSAQLQNPWVLGTFAALMVLFSLSMFGLYQLQMPAAIQQRLAQVSERQARGKLAGVFAMGAVSALIVGPCVAAPLAGALLYISQTGDVVIGGTALFAMAAGMSIPLLLVGVSAGSLLPRAGKWMNGVKQFFGVLLLGMALWLVSPVIPASLQMLGWGVLGAGYGAYLLSIRATGAIAKLGGVLFAVAGALQLAGVATGGRDPLAPIAHLAGAANTHVEFRRVKSTDELDAILASAGGKPVMLDFYADWCVSCKEMEKLTFTDPRVQRHFADMVLLQADVTANDADDKAMLKRFRLFGPPGIIFFDKNGQEVPGGRVIGYQNADRFVRSLETVNAS